MTIGLLEVEADVERMTSLLVDLLDESSEMLLKVLKIALVGEMAVVELELLSVGLLDRPPETLLDELSMGELKVEELRLLSVELLSVEVLAETSAIRVEELAVALRSEDMDELSVELPDRVEEETIAALVNEGPTEELEELPVEGIKELSAVLLEDLVELPD